MPEFGNIEFPKGKGSNVFSTNIINQIGAKILTFMNYKYVIHTLSIGERL